MADSTSATNSDIGAILSGVASILWVLLAAGTVIYFREEIKTLLQAIKNFEIFGQKFTVTKSETEALQASVAAAEPKEAARLSPPEERGSNRSAIEAPSKTDEEITWDLFHLWIDTVDGPTIFEIAEEISNEIREIFFSQSFEPRKRSVFNAFHALSVLVERHVVPAELAAATRQFIAVRNKLAHGAEIRVEERLQAQVSGRKLLESFRDIPRGRYFIGHPAIEIYSDAQGTQVIDDAVGVIIETRDRNDKVTASAIYPTTRRSYVQGNQVAWEWSFERTWGPAWYADPKTAKVIEAWTESAEFVGRELSETRSKVPAE